MAHNFYTTLKTREGGVVENAQTKSAFIMLGFKKKGLLVSTSLPMSNRMRKKMERKNSYQKTKEEFERIQEKRRKKKEVMCLTK